MATDANAWLECLDTALTACLQCPVLTKTQEQPFIRVLQNLERHHRRTRQQQVCRLGKFLKMVYEDISPEMFLLITFSISTRMFLAKHPKNLFQTLWMWHHKKPQSSLLVSFAEKMRPRIILALSKFQDTQSIQSQHGAVGRPNVQENETQEVQSQDHIQNEETQSVVVSWEDASMYHSTILAVLVTKLAKVVQRTRGVQRYSFLRLFQCIMRQEKTKLLL